MSLKPFTMPDLCELLGVTHARVVQLVKMGVVTRVGKNQYAPVSITDYIKFVKDENKSLTKVASVSRLQTAKARSVELRMAREEGVLAYREDLLEIWQSRWGTLMANLAGVPAACTRDLELRKQIQGTLNAALERTAASIREESGRGSLPDIDSEEEDAA